MLDLFWAELERKWIEFIRYPVEALGAIFVTTSFFYALFLGAQYMAGPTSQFGERQDAVVIGYVLWTLVIFIVNDVGINLQVEAQTGTLEQVLLSPYSAPRIFVARALASLTLRLTLISTILGVILLLTGSRLSFPPTLVLPLLSVILGAYGISFLAGSLALLFKRIQQLLGIMQFGLLFLLAVPAEEWQGGMAVVGQLLPMVGGAGLLRDLMARGQGLAVLPWLGSLAVGAGYFALGLLAFKWAVDQAKSKGNLSSY
ncbi:MAG: ABC transporter permease [Synechococcaceae cyanobacterium SM2_3_2]|nr:ABC transporter permease [Synechococcaceae cyanobacterium SM2_3_2]